METEQTYDNAWSYEKLREEDIKKNLETMQKLGLKGLYNKLKSFVAPSLRKNTPSSLSKPSSNLPTSGPPRRSSRLRKVTRVYFAENLRADKKGLLDGVDVKPEIYTEEDEKLLGNTSRSWTSFADGYEEDGKHIYDPVKGKTCHQCRQNTPGYRTHCRKCQLVRGQFCGGCLYMRYGEHVFEAIEDPNWICPVCRGICNCSLCRKAKGWAPTGPLYRKISSLGYKSVAHYLIQTRRAQTSDEDLPTAASQVSARSSLPLEGDSEVWPQQPQVEDKSHGTVENGKEAQLPSSEIHETEVSTKRPVTLSSHEETSRNTHSMELTRKVYDQTGSSNPESGVQKVNLEYKPESMQFILIRQTVSSIPPESNLEKETDMDVEETNCKLHDKLESDQKWPEAGSNYSMPKSGQKLKRKRVASMEETYDCIGARVKQLKRGRRV